MAISLRPLFMRVQNFTGQITLLPSFSYINLNPTPLCLYLLTFPVPLAEDGLCTLGGISETVGWPSASALCLWEFSTSLKSSWSKFVFHTKTCQKLKTDIKITAPYINVTLFYIVKLCCTGAYFIYRCGSNM